MGAVVVEQILDGLVEAEATDLRRDGHATLDVTRIPTRERCPLRDRLVSLSRRELPIGDAARDHLSKCSRCCQELRGLERADAADRKRQFLSATTVRITWMVTASPEGRTLLEAALKHGRLVTTTLLVVIPAACGTWIALMARDMYGTMLGSSAWMMTATWDAPHLLLLWAMWAVMMTAMMLTAAAPLVLLYAGALRTRGEARAGRQLYAMAAGYVVVWALFSVAATALQRVLSSALVRVPPGRVPRRLLPGLLLGLDAAAVCGA